MRQAVEDFKSAFVAEHAAQVAAAAPDVTETDAEALGDAESDKTLDTE